MRVKRAVVRIRVKKYDGVEVQDRDADGNVMEASRDELRGSK